MRILHTSDWHLGKVLMERSLLDDQRHALAQVTRLVTAEAPDLLVISGDVFDRGIPPEDAVTVLGAWLTGLRAAAPSLPVVIIAGNHDSGARLAWTSGLLVHAGVYVRGTPDALEAPVRVRSAAGEEAEVWAVPFLWPGAIPGVSGQAATFAAAIERIRPLRTPGRLQVLVAHCFVEGGRHSDSERTLLGQATQVDPSLFAGFDYVALGHLHRPQAASPHAWYSGSLLAYSFSEADHEKAVLSVEARPGEPPVVTPRPLRPRRPLRVLEGTLEDLLSAPVTDDYLSITLTEPVRVGQPMARLRLRFPNLLHLENPVLAEVVAQAPAPAGAGEDLETDFLSFERHVRGDPLPPDLLAAFQAVRQGVTS